MDFTVESASARYFYLRLMDENGDTKFIMPDRLHPNAAGYQDIWMPAVLPYFREICGK